MHRNELIALRTYHRLTQFELSLALGMGYNAVGKMERGHTPIPDNVEVVLKHRTFPELAQKALKIYKRFAKSVKGKRRLSETKGIMRKDAIKWMDCPLHAKTQRSLKELKLLPEEGTYEVEEVKSGEEYRASLPTPEEVQAALKVVEKDYEFPIGSDAERRYSDNGMILCSVTTDMMDFVDKQVNDNLFCSRAEYVRCLLREEYRKFQDSNHTPF